MEGVKRLQEVCSPLPFRVVIYVFSFVEIRCSTNKRLDQLFGIFKQDRYRKIFFLFPCIHLDYRRIIINARQVQFLQFQGGEKGRLLRYFLHHKDRFDRLKELFVQIGIDEMESQNLISFTLLFSKKNLFPSLKKLGIETALPLDVSTWSQNPMFSSRLEKLNLAPNISFQPNSRRTTGSFVGLEKFLDGVTTWYSLKTLKLVDVKALSKSVIKAPLLQHLQIVHDRVVEERKNQIVIINDGKTLRNVRLERVIIDDFISLLERQIGLGRLCLASVGNIDWLFTKRDVYHFPQLWSLYFADLEISVDLLLIILPPMIQNVEVYGLNGLPSLRLSNPTNLRSIEFENVVVSPNTVSPFFDPSFGKCKNLKTMYISGMVDFNEVIFRECDWNSLENLHLLDLENLSGYGWKRMENLKNLSLSNRVNTPSRMKIRDEFFLGETFPKLRKLYLHGMAEVCGVKWSIASTLKRLWISFCPKFVDSLFFQLNDFPLLKYLSISYITSSEIHECASNEEKGLAGGDGENGWNRMENLETLYLECCDTKDVVFQRKDCFPKLKNLRIRQCKGIKGKEWEYLPCLESFMVICDSSDLKGDNFDDSQYFGEEFWENKPFKDCWNLNKESCIVFLG